MESNLKITETAFKNLKENARALWLTKGDARDTEKTYQKEKIGKLESLVECNKENFWAIIQMFDFKNQYGLFGLCSEETQELMIKVFQEEYDELEKYLTEQKEDENE